jgi:hypothetical protein
MNEKETSSSRGQLLEKRLEQDDSRAKARFDETKARFDELIAKLEANTDELLEAIARRSGVIESLEKRKHYIQ